jgi:hypothetical protein
MATRPARLRATYHRVKVLRAELSDEVTEPEHHTGVPREGNHAACRGNELHGCLAARLAGWTSTLAHTTSDEKEVDQVGFKLEG